MDEKEDKLTEFLDKLAEAGLDKDECKAQIEEIIKSKSETVEDDDQEVKNEELDEVKTDLGEDDDLEDKEEIESEEDLGEDADEEVEEKEEESDEQSDLISDALKACGMDKEDPLIQKAFAEGVKYGEKKEKEEPKELDSEHESEGEKKALGEDSLSKLTKSIAKKIKAEMQAKIKAVNICKRSIGNVDALSFDNAGAIYRKACVAEGLNVKGMTSKECRALYLGYMANKGMANDSKKSISDIADDFLGNVKDSI